MSCNCKEHQCEKSAYEVIYDLNKERQTIILQTFIKNQETILFEIKRISTLLIISLNE